MDRGRLALGLLVITLWPGCAGLGCAPATIVVARKQARSQLRSEPRGLRTDERGRVSEIRRQVIVTDYWVQDSEGRWYRVSEATWRAAEPGRPLDVCR